MKRSVALVVLMLAISLAAAAQSTRVPPLNAFPEAGGIQPLSDETLQSAIQLGKRTKASFPLVSLFVVRQMRLNDPDRILRPTERDELKTLLERGPFTIQIVTPFARVCSAVGEAERKFEAFTPPTIDVANAEKVWVVVGPGPMITTADAVENLIVRRDGETIRPLQRLVEPRPMTTAMNVTRTFTEGRFQFDFKAFAPTAPITLVIVGSQNNLEWTLEVEELKRLR